MSFGATIENETGRLVLDNEHPLYFFKQKASVYSNSGLPQYITVTGCNGIPMVFIKDVGTGYKVCITGLKDLGGGSWEVSMGALSDTSPGSYTGYLTIYVFDVLSPSENVETGYGMNLYNSVGNPVYTTNRKLLKISGYHVTTAVGLQSNPGQPYNIAIQTITQGTVPSSCALAVCSIGVVLILTGITVGSFIAVGARRYSSTQLKFGVGAILGQGPPFNSATYLNANHHILVIDTTLYD